jgi:hypothetical protein
MKSIYFKGSNRRLRELPPPEAMEFFAEYTHSDGATTTACYHLTCRDRLRALLWGRLWLSIKIGKDKVPPVLLRIVKNPFLTLRAKVPMVAKTGCAKCHGTGSTGRDTVTGQEIPCTCLREKDIVLSQGNKVVQK